MDKNWPKNFARARELATEAYSEWIDMGERSGTGVTSMSGAQLEIWVVLVAEALGASQKEETL